MRIVIVEAISDTPIEEPVMQRPRPTRLPATRTRVTVLAIGLAASLGLAGCGAGDDPAVKVATLGTNGAKSDTTKPKKEVTDADRQDAMLKFAACMRDHGIDMPDPEFDADGKGGISVQSSAGAPGESGGAGPDKAQMEKMDAANKACEPIMDAVAGDAPQMSPEDQAKFRDEQLAYAKCMRENGVDMPDPEIDFDGGRTRIKMGGPEDGQRMDPSNETFKKASAACESLLGDGKIGISAAPVGGGDGGGNVIVSGTATAGGK